MMTSPEVSWLFFKARAKRPYLSHTGRASNAEKQPTGPGPEGCVENGPAAALLVGYVSIQICALLAPCRRPILNATTSPLFVRRYTSGADTYLFRHIIHDWSDEQSVLILKDCRKVIPDHGRLLIIEAVVPTGNEPSLAKDFDMVMLVLPGGIERTEVEYRVLLEEAGFQLSSVTPTRSAVSIVEGKPI
jgi:hypothetical protein